MEPLDVIKYVGPDLVLGPVAPMVDSFTLEDSEEAFASRVVTTVSNSAHRADQRIAFKKSLIVTAPEGTLRAILKQANVWTEVVQRFLRTFSEAVVPV